MTDITPKMNHGDRVYMQALRDLAAKAGGSEPALLLTTIVDFLYQHAERLERLESSHVTPTALELATRFHETYERLAPSFGYETRQDTRQFDPESKNGRLMVAVCGELAGLVAASPQVAEGGDGELPAYPPFFSAAGFDDSERLRAQCHSYIASQRKAIELLQQQLIAAQEEARHYETQWKGANETLTALGQPISVGPLPNRIRALALAALKAPTPAAPCAEDIAELTELARAFRNGDAPYESQNYAALLTRTIAALASTKAEGPQPLTFPRDSRFTDIIEGTYINRIREAMPEDAPGYALDPHFIRLALLAVEKVAAKFPTP